MGQAIADAYLNNPRLQAQRAQLRNLDETVIQAASPYRLNVDVTGNLAYQRQRERDFLDRFETFEQKSFGAELSASQIISNGGRTASQVSAAEADVLAGRERLRQVENLILLEVVDSYVSVRRDMEIVAIQERSVESYQRQVDQARAREKGGDLTRTDIAQAQAQLLIAQTSLAEARATLEQDRARFAAVVGRNAGDLDPEPALPGLPQTIGEAFQIAEKESPALQEAIFSEQAGVDRVAAARAERRPVISANGSYGYISPASYHTRDLGHALTGTLTVTIPLLTKGVVDSEVRQAIASRQQLTFLIEDTRRSVDSTLLNAWNASITARDQVTVGEQAVSVANTALEGVRRGFAEGFRSNFEVLDSEQRLLDANLIVANARYSRYASQANLLANLGRLEAAMVEQMVMPYDAAGNLAHQRRAQIGPFQTVLQPLDQIMKPGSRSRAAPALAPIANPAIKPSTTPPPEGGLARELPVGGGSSNAQRSPQPLPPSQP